MKGDVLLKEEVDGRGSNLDGFVEGHVNIHKPIYNDRGGIVK